MYLERYSALPIGKFENAEELGPTLVATESDGWWTYAPSAEAPMRFVRSNGEVIEPPQFYTDLGTIPPIFRWGRLMQPDSYPAVALIHDWIVRQKNCGQSAYSFDESIRIQQEALKTWMETHPRDFSITVFYLTRLALRTPRSKRGWCYQFEKCPPTLEQVLSAQRSLRRRIRDLFFVG